MTPDEQPPLFRTIRQCEDDLGGWISQVWNATLHQDHDCKLELEKQGRKKYVDDLSRKTIV